MRQYARQIDQALRPVLAGPGLPLILAASELLDAIYRSVNSYPGLAADGIAGNPETATAAELAYGVVDEIARRVLLSGGRVLALRRDGIPSQGTVAAILRYPI
jgi:hypothetical protein